MSDSNNQTITGVETAALVASLLGPGVMQDADAADVNDIAQILLNGLLRVAKHSVANTAALTALTGVLDGERVHVRDIGIFRYSASATDSVDGYFVINGPSGVGRFLWFLKDKVDAMSAGGKLASVDSSGLLKSAFKNQIVEIISFKEDESGGAFAQSTSSTSYVDTSIKQSFSFNDAETGDRLFVLAQFFGAATLSTTGNVILACEIDGILQQWGETERTVQGNGSDQFFSMLAYRPVHSAGSVFEVKIQYKHATGSGGAGTYVKGRCSLVAALIRNKVGT